MYSPGPTVRSRCPPRQGTEGEKAQDVLTAYELIVVGRVQNVRVEVTLTSVRSMRLASATRLSCVPGNINIRGTIGRAYINGAMLKLLLGEAADSRPASSFVQPTFNITLLAENAAVPGVRSTVTLHDVKIGSWVYTIPEDDFLLEEVIFQALYLSVEDEA